MRDKAATDCLAALGNRTRLAIFRLLVKAGEDGLTVGALQRRARVPASTLAHHLGALVRGGLVAQERRGREVVCRANYAVMNALVTYLTCECCTGFAADDAASDAA